MASRSSVKISMVIVGALLVLLPLGSYLYIKAGYDYRVKSLSELDDFGSLLSFNLDDSIVDNKHVSVVYWQPDALSDSVGVSIKNLYEAFDHENAVRFVGIGSGAEDLIADKNQAIYVASNSLIKQQFSKISDASEYCVDLPMKQRAIIADTLGNVRRCYDLHHAEQVARLLEHLTILVPKMKKEDIFVERKQEF